MTRNSTALKSVMAIVISVAVAAVAMGGCLGGGNMNPPPGTHDVNIVSSYYGDFSFSPSSLTIHVGENVTWTNNAGTNHDVVSNNTADPFDSGILAVGHSFTHEFNVIGVFPYHCSIHPTMTGTITVIA